jgi:putative heme-binding domain-containing protein
LLFHLNAQDIGSRGGQDENVAVWEDVASGFRFQQSNAPSQPRSIWLEKRGLLRFDGIDDHLRFIGPERTANQISVVLVASPRNNSGDFRGLIAANARGRRDYESGFTIDQGPAPSASFETINWEGAGFGGFQNLLGHQSSFGLLHCVVCTLDPRQKQASLFLDGKPMNSRAWSPTAIALDELTIGARYYTNAPGAQQVRGFFEGDLVEVALFDRALGDGEVATLSKHLLDKHSELAQALAERARQQGPSIGLTRVDNPPAIQMLTPGFTSVELPVKITNVNNVLYRPDGALVTLGYNGDVHVLKDSDGDGIEDHARIFWKNDKGSLRGPIGMVWIPPGFPRGQGVLVASKGKVSALLDTDKDDVADHEWVIAQGWKEIAQNVDAVGMAISPDGYLYFGLGTADYSNPYQVDAQGQSHYDLSSDRGTIQQVNLKTLERETYCTGIRFPIGIAINRNGVLFCTDQEGATWLPNGNPRDELLVIERGKHYGFPPRHPLYNPSVIDEPALAEFGPQHQSTCGMLWNDSNPNGRAFGPTSWHGQAILCGESRGKLWRTQVVSTKAGYVAQPQLMACLQMLTVDSCLAPNGDLVVACHGGNPDWGTGPAGIGKLFRVRMTEPDVPRPIVAWAQSPTELRIAWDKPLRPEDLAGLEDQLSLECGLHVRPGDHFENLIPPYAVVKNQLAAPRYSVPIRGVSVMPDMQTVLIQVPHTQANLHYAVRWQPPGTQTPTDTQTPSLFPGTGLPSIASRPDYAMEVRLDGALAKWQSVSGNSQVLWLPHLDLDLSRRLTQGSSLHRAFFESLNGPGELELHAQLDMFHWLRPKVQSGSKIDYGWPAETVHLTIETNADSVNQNSWEAVDREAWTEIRLRLTSRDASKLWVTPTVSTNEDSRPRPVPLDRLHLPWNSGAAESPSVQTENTALAQLEGGNWGRGRKIFHSETAACFKCHAMGSPSAKIGPDLANLVHRDFESVLRDIVQPSYAIHPDHIGHQIRLDSGIVLTGTIRTEEGRMVVGDAKGTSTVIPRDRIEEMKVTQTSVMPEELLKAFSADQVRDLMTFLLTPPPSMPIAGKIQAPPVRTRAEVERVLADSQELPTPLKPLNLVLVAGVKDHGPGEHDYPAWQQRWHGLLSAAEQVIVSKAWDFPSQEQLLSADVILFFQKGDWNGERAEMLDRYLARGGSAIYLHWAVNGNQRAGEFARRIGLASRGGEIRYRHGPLNLELHSTDHPILRNIDRLDLYDESYWLLSGDPKEVTLLASSLEDGELRPQVWCFEKQQGRVFVSIPGHYNWTFDDPIFRAMLLRAIAWCARQPIDRFNDLVWPGARVR